MLYSKAIVNEADSYIVIQDVAKLVSMESFPSAYRIAAAKSPRIPTERKIRNSVNALIFETFWELWYELRPNEHALISEIEEMENELMTDKSPSDQPTPLTQEERINEYRQIRSLLEERHPSVKDGTYDRLIDERDHFAIARLRDWLVAQDIEPPMSMLQYLEGYNDPLGPPRLGIN